MHGGRHLVVHAPRQAERFGGGAAALRLLNSISAELDTMRPSILPNLIEAAARNEARGYGDPALFEVGPHYKDVAPKDQRDRRRRPRQHGGPRNWAGPPRTVDALRRQGRCAGRAGGASVRRSRICSPPPARRTGIHPGRSGVLRLGDAVMAHFGELHPEILAADLKGPVVAFEVVPRRAPAAQGQGRQGAAAAEALALPAGRARLRLPGRCGHVEAEKLVRAARNADKALITGVAVFDRLCRQGRGRGQEIDRHRRHAAADGAHPDRCGDRGGRRQDRRCRRQGDRRHAPGVGLPHCVICFCRESAVISRPHTAIYTQTA